MAKWNKAIFHEIYLKYFSSKLHGFIPIILESSLYKRFSYIFLMGLEESVKIEV